MLQPRYETAEVFNGNPQLIDRDPSKISWTDSLVTRFSNSKSIEFDGNRIIRAAYRPFESRLLYLSRDLVNRVGQMDTFYPSASHENFGFYVTGVGNPKEFSVLITDAPTDLAFWGSSNGQYFPRFVYSEISQDQLDIGDYVRIDNISDKTRETVGDVHGAKISTDDIFYYTYGLLHSAEYRAEFAVDLKKMLPRIPLVRDFKAFADAGRKLADLHLNYESAKPYDLDEQVSHPAQSELYRVQKMAFGKNGREKDRSTIIYNPYITVSGIPDDAYRYMLGSRSAVEWIMDRYQVKTDKASGIVNDPNDWATELGEPRYILDLLKRIVTVSVETMKIIDQLPPLDVIHPKSTEV